MGHHSLSRESFANDFVPLNIERDFCQGHCIEDDVENSSYLKIQKSHFLLKKISRSLYWRNSLDRRFFRRYGDPIAQKRRNVQVIEKIGQYKYLETDYLI